MADDRKSILEMVAELMREAGILVLVFGFMDAALGQVHGIAIEWFLSLTPALAGILIVGGIVLERKRPLH